MTVACTIDEALLDPALLGAALGDPTPWRAWLVVLKAAFGLPLDEGEAEVFATLAGAVSRPLSALPSYGS